MIRFSEKLCKDVESSDVDAFLEEIALVCEKHRMSLGVFGSVYLSLVVEDFTAESISQLKAADDFRS